MGGAFCAAVLMTAACGGTTATDEQPPTTSTASSSSTSLSFTTTSSSEAPASTTTQTTPSPQPQPTKTPAAAAPVSEGVECGPIGAVAAFADGATAYCSRLQYTDSGAWSRDPTLAPNPAVSSAIAQSGPQIGDQCIGADIGRTATDANRNAILCDNYRWVMDVGQEPQHPWVDDQVEFTECLEQNTQEECRTAHN